MVACPPHAAVNGLEVQNQLELMVHMVSWRQQQLHLGFRFSFIPAGCPDGRILLFNGCFVLWMFSLKMVFMKWRFTADERDKSKMLLAELADILTVLFF